MKEGSKKVEVVPYNPEWPRQFDIEARKIRETLGEDCIDVLHVGSTSVPGLAAKPRIDIIAVLKNTHGTIEKLESIGYQYKGEFNIPFHLGFSRRTEPQVNLHVYEEKNPEIELNLLFRDYLRNHPKVRDEYQQLKFDLLKEESAHVKNNSMFRGYTLGKDEFIKEILQKSDFQRLCFRFACHHQEWEIIKLMRQKYFFDQFGIKDPYDWSVEHHNDLHFILYKGTGLIGYGHYEKMSENKAMQYVFIIEKDFQTKEIEDEFIKLCHLWLKKEGFIDILNEMN